jgi:uncharacterized membrane protein
VHPTRDDPVVAALSEGIGGPVGEHAGRHPWWTPVRVLLALTAVCFALGMLQKGNCYEDAWSDGTARYTHMCYSDLPFMYTGRGFAELNWPYTDDAQVRDRYEVMEYPVAISYWAWATAWATHWVTLLAVWFLSGVNPRRPWDAAAFALSPALALSGLINWDLIAVALTAGALWAWARERPVLTGVLIGLGTAAKLYPLFLLGGLLVICLREQRWRRFAAATLAATAGWGLANLPAYVSGRDQWEVFWTFNSARGADLGSIWLVIEQASNFDFAAHSINVWSWLLFGAWCVGILVLGLRAPETPRLAQLGFLIVAGFLLVNKVYSPQYVLWLLPLAVLARPRWRDQIVWQAGEVLYFAAVWWYLGGYLDAAGRPDAGFYWVAILLRMAAELYLVGIVARDVLVPRHDPVRRPQAMTTRSKAVAV